MNTLRFRTSIVYGNTLLYPMREIAPLWETLTGRRTATKELLEVMVKLGHEVQIDEGVFHVEVMK
jgi:hypothetical protein